mmetsp:Transcript_20922/g.35738  ORF Transcript_20922/g.35738 Transcript_20922/m.35738 type:complete len:92 (-) Transcript_20922:75-350(-)
MSLDLVDSDSLIHIIQYCQAEEAARVGLCNEKWNDKIFQGGKLWKTFATTRWGDGVSLVTVTTSNLQLLILGMSTIAIDVRGYLCLDKNQN